MFQRKLFHVLSLIPAILGAFLNDPYRQIFFTTAFLTVFLIDLLRLRNAKLSKLFMLLFGSMLKRKEYKGFSGATYMFLSFMLVNILFEREIALFGMLVLAICDPIASLIGRYARFNLKLIGEKTLVGMLAFMLSGFVLARVYPFLSMESKLLAVLVASFLEVIPYLDDNLSIPIGVSLTVELKGGIQ